VLLGNVQVRTDANVLVGSGNVIVESVVPVRLSARQTWGTKDVRMNNLNSNGPGSNNSQTASPVQRRTTEPVAQELTLETQREQLRALSRRLVQVQEDERRALSRDLHDTSGQAMTVLNLGLAMLKHEAGNTEQTNARIDDLRHVVETVAEDLHRLSMNLRPSSLDRYGLVPALDQFLSSLRKQTGMEVRFEVEGMEDRLPDDVETALYRIVQEAGANTARYAGATNAAVLLRREGDILYLTVEDNGRGLDVTEALGRGRLGLLGMRERAEMLGGAFSIESSAGHGTRLHVSVPLAGLNYGGTLGIREHSPAAASHENIVSIEPGVEATSAAAELARAKALSDVLVDIMADAARSIAADEMLALMLERSAAAIGCDTVHIDIRDGEEWVTRYDSRGSEVGQRFTDAQVPALTWVERTREVLVVNDTAADVPDESLRLSEYGVRSYACIPLITHDSLQGILCFVNFSVPEPFAPSEITFFNRLVGLAALALENVQLHETEAVQRDALARRVEEFQTLFDVLPVGIGIANDPQCTDIRINPALARMLAIPSESNASLTAEEEEKPGNFKVLVAGQELAPEELPMQVAAAEGREVTDLVVELVRDDGAILTLLEYASPLFDADGRPRGSVGAFVDITDGLAAEVEKARLMAENQRQGRLLSELLAALPLSVCVVRGRDYRLERVNAEYEQVTGLPAAQLVGRAVGDVFPAAGQTVTRMWDKVYATGETLWVHEQLFNLGEGREESYWNAAYVPMRDDAGRVDGILAVAMEVTEQVRTRSQAEQTAVTLEALLDCVPEGITIADAPDVTIRHVSRYGQELLGGAHQDRTAGEVAAQWAVYEADGVTPVAEEDLPLARAIRNGESIRDKELVQVNAHGRRVFLLCNAEPIRSDSGKITGSIVAWRDINVIKEAQAKLAQQEASLREALETATESEERYRLLFTESARMEEAIRAQAAELGRAADTLEQRVQERTASLQQVRQELEAVAEKRATEQRFLASIMDNVPAAITYLDEGLIYRQCNKAAAQEFGIPVEQVLGRRLQDVVPGNPELWAAVEGVLRTGEPYRSPVLTVHWENRPEADRTRHYLVAYLPDKDEEGHVRGVYAEGQDVSELIITRQRLEQTQAELRILAHRIVELQEHERSYVADQLYNQTGQVLSALNMQLSLLERRQSEPASLEQLGQIKTTLGRAIHDLHGLASQLHPIGLHRSNLTEILRQCVLDFGRANNLSVQFSSPRVKRLRPSPGISLAVYRAVQEGLSNVARHAHASQVTLTLTRTDDDVIVSLQDNGIGFDPVQPNWQNGVGLLGIRERIESIGGRMTLHTGSSGTNLLIQVPLKENLP
jgi:PAS domain S-box-containing protein